MGFGAPPAAPAVALTEVASGSVAADGTEQELVSHVGLGTYYGLISLHEMGGADVVEVSLYGRMTEGGDWRRYWKEHTQNPAFPIPRP